MKRVYLVRHGQSEGNFEQKGQGPDVPLTEKGKEQAEFIAERCVRLPIECIISSTYARAQDTAAAIAKKTQKPFESSALFTEKRRPSEQVGLGWADEKFREIGKLVEENFATPDWRYSDEENFEDLKRRVREALAFLAQKSEEHILVVTHGLFLCILLSYVTFGEELTARECLRFIKRFYVENTGLTVFGYDEKSQPNPWWVWVWNDHAHLAEIG